MRQVYSDNGAQPDHILQNTALTFLYMDHICNITFACSPADAPQVIEYLRKELLPALLGTDISHPRLSRIRSPHTDTVNFALEMHISGTDRLKKWSAEIMQPALETTTERWGERLMYFHTLLQPLPLN